MTDPSTIHAIGEVTVEAKGPYDFVRAVGDLARLLEYRDYLGFGILDLKKYKRPELVAALPVTRKRIPQPLTFFHESIKGCHHFGIAPIRAAEAALSTRKRNKLHRIRLGT